MEKLFVYGSLGPGKANEYMLKKIGGTWKRGYVWGELYEEGWGSQIGFPGIRFDRRNEKIEGHVFYSENLEKFWDVLDDFEGPGYERVKVEVTVGEENEAIDAYIYALK